MMQRIGYLAITEGSRYMQRLCFHFGKKVAVQYDDTHGEVTFPWGECGMRSDEKGIHFTCKAESPETLERVQNVIDEHVKLFARKAPLAIDWS